MSTGLASISVCWAFVFWHAHFLSEAVFTLNKMPMPPTDNHAYVSIIRGRTIIRVPSRDLTNYRKAMSYWALLNRDKVTTCKLGLELPKRLSVEFLFHFPKEKLYTKMGVTKKLDATNRLKSSCDALAEILGIDDSFFWRVKCEKIPTTSEAYVEASISEFK